MPPHSSSDDDDIVNATTPTTIMISEADETMTASSSEDKAVVDAPIIDTQDSKDDEDAESVSLTPPSAVSPSKATALKDDNGDEDDGDDLIPSIADPWAQVEAADASPDEEPEKKTLGERWGSFRNRLEKQWQNSRTNSTSSENPDEQPTAVVVQPPPDAISEGGTTARKGGFSRFLPAAAPKKPAAAAAAIDPTKTMSADEMASFRASRISVTLQKESRDSKWGFGMKQQKQKNGTDSEMVEIAVMAGMGLLEHAPFQVGDILVSVNNQKCTDAEATIQELVKMDGGTTITLLVETPQGNPNLVQAMVRKSSPDVNLGIGFYTPAAVAEDEAKKEETLQGDEQEKDTQETAADDSETSPSSEATDEDTTNKPPTDAKKADKPAAAADDHTSKLLRINNIDSNGLLALSALRQGDIVVAINATPCSQMTAEQAEELLKQSQDSVTIIAMKPPTENTNRFQRWMRHAKRAGVAIGGGTLVGVGLIFIPTLPPPFGEVLIVGGVSVLGTEFEAPKRVMRSARDSLERAVGREGDVAKQESTTTGTEGTEDASLEKSETASTTTDGDASEDAAADNKQQQLPPKKTMGDRFKNFGRIHVLPFLDQVVGDRKKEEEDGEETPSAEQVDGASPESTTATEEVTTASENQTDEASKETIPPTTAEEGETEEKSSA